MEKFPLFLLKAYQKFHQDYPNVSLEFVPLSFNQHIQALKNKEVDLSIIARPLDNLIQDLTFTTLYQDTYSFCMSFYLIPLSFKKRLTKNDLKKYPILVGQYSYLKDSFESQLPKECQIIQFEQEYDLSTCSNLLVSNETMLSSFMERKLYTSFKSHSFFN